MIRIRTRKIAAIGALVCAIIIGIMLACCITAEAKNHPQDGKVTDSAGNTYIYKAGKLQTGWIWYKGECYYAHKTKSRMYPKGAVCKNTYRVRGKRMYYFDGSGKRIRKSTQYITLNRASGSVHYIHAPGMIRRYRYNANRRRYQYLDDSGKWVNDGGKCWPTGMVDWQE